MKNKNRFLFAVFLVFVCALGFAVPLHSPTWGFRVDLPVDYTYVGGDGKDRFSFENSGGAQFDLIVYYASPGKDAPYASLEALAGDVRRRLDSKGDMDSFEYRQKTAFILELSFEAAAAGGRGIPMSGWGLCMELGNNAAGSDSPPEPRFPPEPRPMLLAIAYGPAARTDLQMLHFSALDSISPQEGDRYAPGPITEYSYPRETRAQIPLFALGISAWMYREDAEAAQALVDREFQVLRRYVDAPNWQEAWQRFYRAIYRDSFDRLADAAFQVERKINVPSRPPLPGQTDANESSPPANRDFADKVLQWVQSFSYERDFMGSDFVNLVSAATEGRGDCDSRAMLWAIVLNRANIPSAIMVSRHYSHAMGLADLPGPGARFEVEGQKLLVAETTAKVSIGLIGETVSDIAYWLGISFE